MRSTTEGRLLAVLLLGPFMAQVDATIANVATPSIHADLGASGPLLELVIGGYLIAFAVLLITGARLGQSHGYRRVLLLGVSVFTFASLLCGLAPNPLSLVVARVLQGFGAALMFPQTLTGIQLNFTGGRLTRAVGLYAIALSSGAVAGQMLGGALISADLVGQWRAIFLVNVPVGVLAIAAALRYLPPDRQRLARRLDLGGVVTLSIAISLIVVPLSLGRSEGWPAWTWLSLAAGALMTAGFLQVERRVAANDGAPLIAVAVLARPAIRTALLTLTAATSTYYALLFTLAQYLQAGLGRSPLVSGLTLVPWVASFGLAGQLLRRLPARAARTTPVAGCVLLCAAYAAISAASWTGHHDEPLLIVLLGAGGLGLGAQFSSVITHLTTVVPADYAPDISGVSTTTMQIGGAIGVAAFGTLYFGMADRPGPTRADHAFALTTAVLAAIALLAALTAYHTLRLQTPQAVTPAHQHAQPNMEDVHPI